MCTCITYKNGDFYFGRNLDLDCSFGENVAVTPRNFPLRFSCGLSENEENMQRHYAMIGMASANESFPLYAEAVNEKGLCMAGLNFPGNAFYQNVRTKEGASVIYVAPYEIIPWILARCASVEEAGQYLKKMEVVDLDFSPEMPSAPLHWMLADREKCLVLEAVREGLKIYENPFGVLTNNPSFEYHRINMNNYLNLMAGAPQNRFALELPLKHYSQGMGGIGLPGDASSASRFVRATFLKWNSAAPEDERSSVLQFFHILDGVAMVRGTVVTEKGTFDMTTYSCCVNADTGVYYYKTYEDSRIRSVDMRTKDLEGEALIWE